MPVAHVPAAANPLRTHPALAGLHQAEQTLNRIVVGKSGEVRLALTSLLAQGHLLLEDLPGVGKTTLAHALAQVFDLSFHRVQFTSDLLPSDLTGVSIYQREAQKFEFHPGPLFTQVLLADELNRGSPKTQSALLEAMAEGTVTVDGITRDLPQPFFVIATQNPAEQVGTFALPESQLDRFLMSISMGYPDPKAERELLRGEDRRELLKALKSSLPASQLQSLQLQVPQITVSDHLLDYLQRLIAASRDPARFRVGLSPRAGLSLLRAARAYALLADRDYVRPEDLKAVFVACTAHRLVSREAGGDLRSEATRLLKDVVAVQ